MWLSATALTKKCLAWTVLFSQSLHSFALPSALFPHFLFIMDAFFWAGVCSSWPGAYCIIPISWSNFYIEHSTQPSFRQRRVFSCFLRAHQFILYCGREHLNCVWLACQTFPFPSFSYFLYPCPSNLLHVSSCLQILCAGDISQTSQPYHLRVWCSDRLHATPLRRHSASPPTTNPPPSLSSSSLFWGT